MNRFVLPVGAALATLLLAACGGGGGSVGSAPAQAVSDSVAAFPRSSAESVSFAATKTVYVGFAHTKIVDPKYGELAFYAPTTGAAKAIYANVGTPIVFLNDDTTKHTASGLGASGFPKEFDNTSETKQVGTMIANNKTWASGSLNPGQSSPAFKLGPVGTYYFGCYYHYHVTPSMRNVIISQKG
ncbi:MAG: hypothetical protein IAI50_14535 [Candidatus Eremiobacteraeota bacterium]|nr:hypothetical protein [Candidatus Eremiobacteraeota bacterium]